MSAERVVLTDIMTALTVWFCDFLRKGILDKTVSSYEKKVMGIFDKFKSQREIVKEEIVEVPWHMLTSVDQLDALVSESNEKPVAIFKHSTRCGISRMVLKQFEKLYSLEDSKLKLYFLDLLEHRDISNEIALRFKVYHESPQLIVLRNGAVVHQDSHHSIDAGHLEKYS